MSSDGKQKSVDAVIRRSHRHVSPISTGANKTSDKVNMSVSKTGGMESKKTLCGSCGKEVKSGDKAMFCEICELWHHTHCENVSDELYGLIQKQGDTPALHWYCNKCNTGFSKVITTLGRLENLYGKLEKKVDNIETVVSQHDKAVHEIRDKVHSIDKTIVEVAQTVEEVAK